MDCSAPANDNEQSNYLMTAVIEDIVIRTNQKNCPPDVWQAVAPLRQFLLLSNVEGLPDQLAMPNLTYSEKKVVREFLEKQIELNCQPVVELFEKYTNNQLAKVADMQTESKEEILRLEFRRQELTRELGRLKNDKNELLKQCADLRVAAHQKNTVGLLNAEMRYTEMKAKMLENIMTNEAVSRTQNSQNAIKQVENHLNEILKS